MKYHLKIFIISLTLVTLCFVLSRNMEMVFPVALVEQAKAISYLITLVGIVVVFSWYKRTAVLVEQEASVSPPENTRKQKRVLLYLLIVNAINAGVLLFSSEQSIGLMIGISLMVVLIAPFIFKTMDETEGAGR